jgi:hypothetical protein
VVLHALDADILYHLESGFLRAGLAGKNAVFSMDRFSHTVTSLTALFITTETYVLGFWTQKRLKSMSYK